MDEAKEAELIERIRRKAFELWVAEGQPQGRAEVHWDQATELVAIEDNQLSTTKPVQPIDATGPTGEPIEPIEVVKNTGEFPTMVDQGEALTPDRDREREIADKRPLAPGSSR